MVQRFHHPLVVLNCDDTPSSPDGMSLNGVNDSHGIYRVLHAKEPYKIPNLGVLGRANVVAAIDGPWKGYLVDVVLPVIPRHSLPIRRV